MQTVPTLEVNNILYYIYDNQPLGVPKSKIYELFNVAYFEGNEIEYKNFYRKLKNSMIGGRRTRSRRGRKRRSTRRS
jgi:hypothetical protein